MPSAACVCCPVTSNLAWPACWATQRWHTTDWPVCTGLGRKSVACIMLLTLGKKEFPVDTNVGRICAR